MTFGIINFTQPEISGLASVVYWLVGLTSSVAAGVVLFTVLLKLITLPFDFISRFSMRKNSIKMEQMRPELEKLQKQYADNKGLYSQKMMALYKKNGYSMFGACLPTIVTLVIFIIAISAFSSYSKFQNRKYFYEMSCAYNGVVYAGFETDDEYIKEDENGNLVFADTLIVNSIEGAEGNKTVPVSGHEIIIEKGIDGANGYYTVKTTDGYAEYKRYFTVTDGEYSFGKKEYSVIEDKLTETSLKSDKNNNLKLAEDQGFAEYKTANPENNGVDFLKEIGSFLSSETFKNNNSSFLWVKNIWVSDVSFKHPVEKEWKTFVSTYGYDEEKSSMTEDDYKLLIKDLESEQTAPNGYFILVALTALSSLAMQLILSKSQKAQMELQTVDGQGAQTQKIMTWMMPIMMAFFAFMYTAAFSIYIILSSLISLATTLIINKIADKKFNKPVEENVIRGRVYNPPVEENKKKDEKKNKKQQVPEADFLSGLADKKKKPRGRLK